jgi:hypothetical protein
MAEYGHDVVVLEGPGAESAKALEVWIMDDETVNTNTHRSVVVDSEGDEIGDHRFEDD